MDTIKKVVSKCNEYNSSDGVLLVRVVGNRVEWVNTPITVKELKDIIEDILKDNENL